MPFLESDNYITTWACDRRDDAEGCRRSLSDFGLHTGVPQFRCNAEAECNYVLCDACYEQHFAASDAAPPAHSPIVTPPVSETAPSEDIPAPTYAPATASATTAVTTPAAAPTATPAVESKETNEIDSKAKLAPSVNETAPSKDI
jgi:hypothetical protein